MYRAHKVRRTTMLPGSNIVTALCHHFHFRSNMSSSKASIMDERCPVCFFELSRNDDHLVICSLCKKQCYCTDPCQQLDHPRHKHDCTPGGGDITSKTPKINSEGDTGQANYTIESRILLEQSNKIFKQLEPKEESYLLYYIGVSKARYHEKFITGPYDSPKAVIDRIMNVLGLELCKAGIQEFRQIIQTCGIRGFTLISSQVPSGDHMTIELIKETNADVVAQVALIVRSSVDVYRVDVAYASPETMEYLRLSHKSGSDMYNTLGSYLSMDKANGIAEEMLSKWEKDAPGGQRIQRDRAGLILGVVRGIQGDVKEVGVHRIEFPGL
ncbi:hypothetical protein K491DRAFT_491447 [Lophiostoma macrostomum CBS 122681]|uniref:MYND-type domain-containing protein n=1 Tax=Lophiostoma macrostomum CBS 122681 TaxID=1314788 RepID=A0A6A6T2F6_9PLEO|nr:hypothetical protein K491DRAFT_491447 [Lophiostoma macrostomum CBS 122681]